MAMTTSPKKEVHNIKSYFSGHYQTYGINIQAACGQNCHFLLVGVSGPGVMGDREAVKEPSLTALQTLAVVWFAHAVGDRPNVAQLHQPHGHPTCIAMCCLGGGQNHILG